MRWWPNFNRVLWFDLQDFLARRSVGKESEHEDPELELPDAIVPEQEQHVAIEREAARRASKGH